MGQAEASAREDWSSFCQGPFPVISSSKEKLRKFQIGTITANTPTLAKVGATATARMMSAATTNRTLPSGLGYETPDIGRREVRASVRGYQALRRMTAGVSVLL